MPFEYTKGMLAAACIVTFVFVGLLVDVTSLGGRLVLAVAGFVPPLAMLLFWHAPSQTMSEIIQRARK